MDDDPTFSCSGEWKKTLIGSRAFTVAAQRRNSTGFPYALFKKALERFSLLDEHRPILA